MASLADILREEGIEMNNKEFVRNLLKGDHEIATIAKYTGLSKKEVEKTIEELEH